MNNTTDTKLQQDVKRYIAALASSGDNFRIAGEPEPISDELKEEYADSFLNLVEATVLEVIGDDVPFDGASKTKRYSDIEIVTSLNSQKSEQRQHLASLLGRGTG